MFWKALLFFTTLHAPAFAKDAELMEALPTKNGAYATAGEVLEVGYLVRDVHMPRALRLGFALQTYRAQDLVGQMSGSASWAPLAVFEYAFADATFRPSLLLRAGYLFTRRALSGVRNIVDDDDGLTLQPGFAIDLFQAARLHVALRWRLLNLAAMAGPMIHSNVAFNF